MTADAANMAALPQLPWIALPAAAIPLATVPIGPGIHETGSAIGVTTRATDLTADPPGDLRALRCGKRPLTHRAVRLEAHPADHRDTRDQVPACQAHQFVCQTPATPPDRRCETDELAL